MQPEAVPQKDEATLARCGKACLFLLLHGRRLRQNKDRVAKYRSFGYIMIVL